jgi:hypothetical protein
MDCSPLFPTGDHLIRFLGLTSPKQIDLDAIGQRFGATIRYRRTEGCEGRLVGAGARAIITVNDVPSIERRRFSAAHELAHWLLNRGTIAKACSEDTFQKEWVDHTIERRANQFAAELLLPEVMVRPFITDCDVSFAMVDQLSAHFKTSFTATAMRLVELAEFPAMLICSEHGRRRWFVRSLPLPEDFTPYRKPRRGTATVDVLSSAFAKGDVRRLTGDRWIGSRQTRNEPVYEEVRRLSGNLAFSLLTW